MSRLFELRHELIDDYRAWPAWRKQEARFNRHRRRKSTRNQILFRCDEQGFYFIVGRIKEMIKRAGENVSATEVETVLRSMDAIDEAAVVPVPDPLRREKVKAYLKLRDGLTHGDLPPDVVFEHCARHLAPFKVPRYLQYIEGDFPRTPSRKIAKKRLVAETVDPFAGTFDRQESRWR